MLAILSCLTTSADSQGHFVKDQAIEGHQFPPRIEETIKGLPRGHLRPLGQFGGFEIFATHTNGLWYFQVIKN